MNKGLLWICFGFFAFFFTSGCATLIDGSTQKVTFKSSPEKVSVMVNGQTLGETPIIVDLERQSENVVEFYKEGYAKQSLQMESRMNGLVWVNAIWCLSCLLSTTTDFASGAAYQYDPDKYFVIMVPEGVSETPSDTQKRKVRAFIMGNYTKIISELSKIPEDLKLEDYFLSGYGEYLDSLISLLESLEPDRKKAAFQIKTISKSTKDSLNFSDEVIKAFFP